MYCCADNPASAGFFYGKGGEDMNKTRFITKFLFDFAQYRIYDEKNNEVLLKIDYANNTYTITEVKKISLEVKQEIEEVARLLLKRKHGVNRANNVLGRE